MQWSDQDQDRGGRVGWGWGVEARGQDDIKTKRDGWWWWPLVINTDSSSDSGLGRERELVTLSSKANIPPSLHWPLSRLQFFTAIVVLLTEAATNFLCNFSALEARLLGVKWVRFVDVITGWLSTEHSDCCVGFGCQDNYVINTDSELANYRLVWPGYPPPELISPVWQMIRNWETTKWWNKNLICSKLVLLELIKSVKTC